MSREVRQSWRPNGLNRGSSARHLRALVSGARPACLALAALALAAGCKKDSGPAHSGPAVITAADGSEQIQFRDEVFGDPVFARSSHLQFIWRLPGEEKKTVWTIKLDGTDLLRVLPPQVLLGGDAVDVSEAVRSPDGRYLACSSGPLTNEGVRFLVDLEKRTVRTMMKADGAPQFNWTPDSKSVTFYADLKLWQHDVETAKTSKLPMIYSAGLYLIEQGQQFAVLQNRRVEYYDRAGKLLKKFPNPYEVGQYRAASADGKTFFLDLAGKSIVFDAEHPDPPIFRDEKFRWPVFFGSSGKTLYYFDADLIALDIASAHETKLAKLGPILPEAPTFINARTGP